MVDVNPTCGVIMPLVEAFARLTTYDPVTTRFECRPNSGATYEGSISRLQAINLLIRASHTAAIFEGGATSQAMNFGLYIECEHKYHGRGVLFFQTRPECKLSAEQLAESCSAGVGQLMFSRDNLDGLMFELAKASEKMTRD